MLCNHAVQLGHVGAVWAVAVGALLGNKGGGHDLIVTNGAPTVRSMHKLLTWVSVAV
jgi:hypothetical protein